jgi:O-antigen/teichoic acid export membrane protein
MLESPASPPISHPRLRRFFYAVASGYAQLVANVLYTLASVPLALHFLQKREFGLWALATQLGGYLQLIDLGMSASVSRHLIDHKDNRNTGAYGGMIKTGGLVLLVQGLLVLAGGALVVLYGTQFLHIDPDLEHSFKVVMFLQCAIIAADFPARLFSHVLVAHQRADIANYSQTGFFFASFATLWYCFARGLGVVSLVWANFAGWLVIVLANIIACSVLRLLPSGGAWGSATWSKFRELFSFGKDVFWIALGTQMINASQAIVVTRTLGLNSAAVWSICTRTYTLVNQLVWRPFDFSSSMLAEMVVRREKDRLLHRFKGLVVLTTSLAMLAAVMFSLCNGPFVAVWTHRNIAWSTANDFLLSVWMIILALVHCHCGLVVITKRIGFMRYIYFLEGITFIGIGSYASARVGFPGLVITSIFCSLAFSFSYGIWRTAQQFHLPLKDVVFRWLAPPAQFFVPLSLLALLLYWSARFLSPEIQLALYAVFIGVAGLLFLRYGIGSELWQEFRERAPVGVSRFLRKLFVAQ